ncbi:MAG: glycosyltransferase family 4 protein [Gammaproteobacteria bacterium]|nr:glycosyltransferase family 4 protein [Gammaproteobacteria bacterium]
MARARSPARILTSYYRPKPGGLCKRLFRAIEALLARGHVVHYLAVEPFPIDHPGCRFHRFPWPRSRADGPLFWAAFCLVAPWLLLVLGWRHRVTHLFAFTPTYALCLQPLRVTRQAPLALFLRADEVDNHRLAGKPAWIARVQAVAEGLALRGARVFAVSGDLARRMVARHPRCRAVSVSVLRNDIPAAAPPPARGLVAAPARLAAVGVIEPRKNPRVLVESLAALPEGLATLDFFGAGPSEPDLCRLVRDLGVADRVRFRGWVESSRIWGDIDLLLMPSRHEGAPNAALEAIAHDVPFLASRIPEHEEIFPAASLVDGESPQLWANRIEDLLRDPATNLSHLREQVAAHTDALRFDWDEAVCGAILASAEPPARSP